MEMCSKQHEQVVFERGTCPVCSEKERAERLVSALKQIDKVLELKSVWGINLSSEMLPNN